VRWPSSDVKSLELVAGTPVNCLLLEESNWSKAFIEKAAAQGLTTLAVVRPGGDAAKARAVGVPGAVLEGDFDTAEVERIKPVVELSLRRKMKLDGTPPITGTYQGVWAGIRVEEDGAAHAAPTGGPWIDTNSGFLRFARSATGGMVWIGNVPPPKTVVTAERYIQAVADAAMVGARWVIALDADFSSRLLEREAAALRDWKRITDHVRFYEENKSWRNLRPYGDLALVQDAASGALVSGGVLDMIAVKHTPVRPVPVRRLSPERMSGAKMAVNVDPSVLTEEQKLILRKFAAGGGTLLSGPPDWKFPTAQGDSITLTKEEVEKLDQIWREVNSMTGRRNLGARLFNVSSMLSNLTGTEDGSRLVLHLVNYSGYPVESIAAHVLGKYSTARLHTPENPPQELKAYAVEEGTGVDIDKIHVVGAVVLER
jgi:hypothetical protein